MKDKLDDNKTYIKDSFEYVYNFLKNQKSDIKLDILGGEPFLVKDLEYITDKLAQIKIENTIFTNGKYIRKVNDFSTILVSIHYEYLNDLYMQNILNRIKDLKNKIIFSFTYSIKTDENILKHYIKKIKDLGYFCELNFIYHNEYFTNYNMEKIIKRLDIEEMIEPFKFKINGKDCNYYDYLKINPKSYKNCFCFLNVFDIDYDLNVKYTCVKDILFNLKDYKGQQLEINKLICKKDMCINTCFTETNRIILNGNKF